MARFYLIHSTTARPLAAALRASLNARGHRVYRHVDAAGSDFDRTARRRAIDNADAIVVLLDTALVRSRGWRRLVAYARARDTRVVPVVAGTLPATYRVPSGAVDVRGDIDPVAQQLDARFVPHASNRRVRVSVLALLSLCLGLIMIAVLILVQSRDRGLSVVVAGQRDSDMISRAVTAQTATPDQAARGEGATTHTPTSMTPLTGDMQTPDAGNPQAVIMRTATGSADMTATPLQMADMPLAAFSLSPISGTAPLTVAFTNASSGQIDAYAWDFNGDGIIDSTLRNPPPFTLATPGSYRVTLTVSGPMGEASSTTLVQVTAAGASATPNPEDDLPFASIYASPMSGDAPLTVTFENDSLGEISSYAWDFNGDGLIDSTAQNPPPYVYREPGAYSVTLDVNGPAGAGYGDDILIVVYGGEDAPTLIPTPTRTPEPDDPFASFFASPTSGDAPLTVSFVNETLGDAVRYAWDFNGDGVTDSTAQNPPSFTYIVEGTFDASLTVTGASGFSDTYTASIIVYGTAAQVPAPVARFSVSPQTGPAPLTITFTDESTGQIGGYAWDFNADGAADFRAANPPPYTFANPGTYRVALIVNGPGGVSAPFTLNITVQPPVSATPAPTVTATASPTQSVTVTLSPSATPDALDDVPSATPIGTSTPTASAMITITATVTPSFTATPTATITPVSPTPMPTSTASPTSAASPTTAPEVSPEATADVTP